MRRKEMYGLSLAVAAAFLMSGCTVRVVHQYEGAEAPKEIKEVPAKEKAAPEKKTVQVKTEKKKPAPPAVRKADKITLEATRDTRFTHHSSEVNRNSGKSNRLRTRGIERGSAELVVVDFDRAKLKGFVKKYEGQSFSGKLKLHVRQVQNGSAEVKVCALETASEWNEGSGVLDKAKPGEATVLEAKTGQEKWVTPEGKEVKEFKDLIYRDGEIIVKDNEHGVNVSDSGPVEIQLDEEFIRHYATSPNVKGLVLYHWDNDAKIDFFSRDQYGKAQQLVVETK
ncbi:MAG: hypothetical protein ACOC6C_05725 [Verrucomicrobiota bacterium]